MRKFIKLIFVVIGIFVCTHVGYSQEDVITTTVEFVVNTNNFVKNQNYNNFIYSLVPYIKDNADKIECITLVGSASPEGNVKHNIHLANIRADRIYSYIGDFVPRKKVVIDNDYGLFLRKTGLDESDYAKLRATYIEIKLKEPEKPQEVVRDTIYLERTDTLYRDTLKVYERVPFEGFYPIHKEPVFAVYNDLVGDMAFRLNLGAEVYFNKMSFFMEGSFSDWTLFGKTYNIDFWHAGLRKYFNNDYDKLFIEIHANAGYFDTDLFSTVGKIGALYGGGIGIGYVFSLCSHWKLSFIGRIGLFEKIYYADYYYTENGGINISFGNYSNGNINNTNSPIANKTQDAINARRTLTREFFENSDKAYYVGPTYIGIVLKRDFCVNKNKEIKKD